MKKIILSILMLLAVAPIFGSEGDLGTRQNSIGSGATSPSTPLSPSGRIKKIASACGFTSLSVSEKLADIVSQHPGFSCAKTDEGVLSICGCFRRNNGQWVIHQEKTSDVNSPEIWKAQLLVRPQPEQSFLVNMVDFSANSKYFVLCYPGLLAQFARDRTLFFPNCSDLELNKVDLKKAQPEDALFEVERRRKVQKIRSKLTPEQITEYQKNRQQILGLSREQALFKFIRLKEEPTSAITSEESLLEYIQSWLNRYNPNSSIYGE